MFPNDGFFLQLRIWCTRNIYVDLFSSIWFCCVTCMHDFLMLLNNCLLKYKEILTKFLFLLEPNIRFCLDVFDFFKFIFSIVEFEVVSFSHKNMLDEICLWTNRYAEYIKVVPGCRFKQIEAKWLNQNTKKWLSLDIVWFGTNIIVCCIVDVKLITDKWWDSVKICFVIF